MEKKNKQNPNHKTLLSLTFNYPVIPKSEVLYTHLQKHKNSTPIQEPKSVWPKKSSGVESCTSKNQPFCLRQKTLCNTLICRKPNGLKKKAEESTKAKYIQSKQENKITLTATNRTATLDRKHSTKSALCLTVAELKLQHKIGLLPLHHSQWNKGNKMMHRGKKPKNSEK